MLKIYFKLPTATFTSTETSKTIDFSKIFGFSKVSFAFYLEKSHNIKRACWNFLKTTVLQTNEVTAWLKLLKNTCAEVHFRRFVSLLTTILLKLELLQVTFE